MNYASIREAWGLAESQFAENDYLGSTAADHFSIAERSPMLLLTAVHGVRHKRGHVVKMEDQGTGGLVLALGEACGWSTAVVLREEKYDDANKNAQHPLKLDLATRVVPQPPGALVDVHGMKRRGDLDISIGLGREANRSREVGECLASAFADHSLIVDLGAHSTKLRGRSRGSVTAWAQTRGWSAVQLEIAPRLRKRSATDADRECLLRAFVQGLDAVSSLMTERD